MPRKDPSQLDHARSLRTNMTGPEQRLWQQLRGKRLNGVKFTRQVLIGPFIVDFAARDRGLVIELDGDTHATQVAYDARRTAEIEKAGFRVVRFTNAEVMGNMDGVLQMIVLALAASPLPNRQPAADHLGDGQDGLPPGGEREP